MSVALRARKSGIDRFLPGDFSDPEGVVFRDVL
jgi:hypothetical protein